MNDRRSLRLLVVTLVLTLFTVCGSTPTATPTRVQPVLGRRQQRLALVLSQAAWPRQRRAGQLAVQLLASRVEFPDAATAMVVVRTGLIERAFGWPLLARIPPAIRGNSYEAY